MSSSLRHYFPLLLALCILAASSQLAKWLKNESQIVALSTPTHRISTQTEQIKQVIVSHGFVRIYVDVHLPPPPPPPPLSRIKLNLRIHRILGSPTVTPILQESHLQYALNWTCNLWSRLAALDLQVRILRDTITPQNDVKLRSSMMKENAKEAALARYLPTIPVRDDWALESELHLFLLGSIMGDSESIGWGKRMYLRVPSNGKEKLALVLSRAIGRTLSLRHPSKESCDKLCLEKQACNLMCDDLLVSTRPKLVMSQINRGRASASELENKDALASLLGTTRTLGRSTDETPLAFSKDSMMIFLGQRINNASTVVRARFVLKCSETVPYTFKTLVALLEHKKGMTRCIALGSIGRLDAISKKNLAKLKEMPQHENEKCPLRHFEMFVDPPVLVSGGSRIGIAFSSTEAQMGLVQPVSSKLASLQQQAKFDDISNGQWISVNSLSPIEKTSAALFNVVLY